MTVKSGTVRPLPEGASFELMTNAGFKGRTYTSNFYLYSPSHPNLDFVMSRMLNSVLFVYPDKPYAGETEAWKELVDTGLLELAEKEAIYVIMPLPITGHTWSNADVKNYFDSQYYLAGGDCVLPLNPGQLDMEYDRKTFNIFQYVIAEGAGATFVNNILSPHGRRIGGILTFGGTVDPATRGTVPVPAYLVNGDKAAVAYYKTLNETDTEEKPGVFVNSGYPLKKVITAKGGNTFDAGAIADAWTKIFSRTTKACFTQNIVFNTKSTAEWVLMDRPNYKELGITRIDHRNEKLPDGEQAIWYEFVPDSVMANPKTKVPLVITLHGGNDDPVYHPESNGWVAKAAEKGFIIASPAYNMWTGESIVLSMLEYVKKNYPVDEKRVYLSGFSMGGSSSSAYALRNLDQFAAITVMGNGAYADEKIEAIVEARKGRINLPFAMIIGTNDENFAEDKDGNKCLCSVNGIGIRGYRQLLKINSLELGEPDFARYPYWGYRTEDQVTLVDKNLRYHVSYLKKDGKPIVKFALFQNAGHAHSEFFATLSWDFMSRFSR